jgi:coenzyme PQQ synthesis protein D (PqqD)
MEVDPALPRSVLLECAAMTISFSDRVSVPDDVLISRLQEESVILNLDSERYFGLDEIGTRFLSVLTTSDSIEVAYQRLSDEYHVDGNVLRQDLLELVENLINQGILIRDKNP